MKTKPTVAPGDSSHQGLVTFGLLVWFGGGVVSFGLAQVAYGVTVAATYLGYFSRTIRAEGHACGYRSLSEVSGHAKANLFMK